MGAIKNVRTALKKMQLDRETDEAKKVVAHRMIKYVISMVQECFNSYGKTELDGKGMKLLQEVLLSVRFPRTAASLFGKWYEWKMAQAEAELEAQPETKK